MAKKLIQACAVFIAITAIIYGNKPIQQPQFRRNPMSPLQTPGRQQWLAQNPGTLGGFM